MPFYSLVVEKFGGELDETASEFKVTTEEIRNFTLRDILTPCRCSDSDAKWRLVVPKGKSIVVRDLKTRDIVLVVLCNFLADHLALLWAQQEGAAKFKSVRVSTTT